MTMEERRPKGQGQGLGYLANNLSVPGRPHGDFVEEGNTPNHYQRSRVVGSLALGEKKPEHKRRVRKRDGQAGMGERPMRKKDQKEKAENRCRKP